MAGFFANGSFTGCGADGEVESLGTEIVHWHAVQKLAGVDVHIPAQELIASRSGHDLYGRNKRKVCYGAVPCDEVDHVAAGGHLTGNALQIVARAVHEVVTGTLHRPAIGDDVIEADVRMSLHGRTNRL